MYHKLDISDYADQLLARNFPRDVLCVEECSELIEQLSRTVKLLSKNRRGDVPLFALKEETCDVITTFYLFALDIGMTDYEISEAINTKIFRAITQPKKKEEQYE